MYVEEEKKSQSNSPKAAKSKNSDGSKSPTSKFSQLSISNKKVKTKKDEIDKQLEEAPTFKSMKKGESSPKSKEVQSKSPALQLTGTA